MFVLWLYKTTEHTIVIRDHHNDLYLLSPYLTDLPLHERYCTTQELLNPYEILSPIHNLTLETNLSTYYCSTMEEQNSFLLSITTTKVSCIALIDNRFYDRLCVLLYQTFAKTVTIPVASQNNRYIAYISINT